MRKQLTFTLKVDIDNTWLLVNEISITGKTQLGTESSYIT